MHGRVRVRTTAEQLAKKKQEENERSRQYRMAMDRIMDKRAAKELDDEMLQLTAKVLLKNPDISTLWNIRREYILAKININNNSDYNRESSNEPELSNPESCTIVVSDPLVIDQMMDKELSLTESCLLANPKSYNCFHHRCWILKNTKEPNYKRELDLCTKYIRMDERNFHCWDHRRYIVQMAGDVSLKSELDFCTARIKTNFSNYSSWHYRSQLLSILYPNKENRSCPITDEVLKQELELVLKATFTDPDDSSAWFYQRWLLGYSEPELDIVAFKLSPTYAIMSFTKPINLQSSKYTLLLDGTKLENKNWQSINQTEYDKIWMLTESFEFSNENECVYQLEFIDNEWPDDDRKHTLIVTKFCNHLFGIKMPKFTSEFSCDILDLLRTQMNDCYKLFEDDSSSKWGNLTYALLMRVVKCENYHNTSIDILKQLKMYDPMRIGYYTDLMDKWQIEYKLESWIKSQSYYIPLDLSNLNLQTIFYEEYLCVADDLLLMGNDDKLNLTTRTLAKLDSLKKSNVNVKIY